MPVTRWTFFIYCLAIAGIVPFAGFFSKDAILAGAFTLEFALPHDAPDRRAQRRAYPKIWGALVLAALCTAFYMWLVYFVVFTGRFRAPRSKAPPARVAAVDDALPAGCWPSAGAGGSSWCSSGDDAPV